MNARFYLGSIGRFASADTIVPDLANPQAFNRYSYTINNPLKYTDPGGHRYYEPACDCIVDDGDSDSNWDSNLDRAFDWDPVQSKRIGNLASGWTISENVAGSQTSAGAIGASVSGDAGPISMVTGGEILLNDNTNEISLFWYSGGGTSIGAGANGAVYLSGIHDLESNAAYRGQYLIVDATAAVGVGGLTTGGFGVPELEEGALTISEHGTGNFIGYAFGANMSVSANLVWYEELVTVNLDNGEIRMNGLLFGEQAFLGYVVWDPITRQTRIEGR